MHPLSVIIAIFSLFSLVSAKPNPPSTTGSHFTMRYHGTSFDRVLLAFVDAVEFRRGEWTTARARPAVPQLRCVGGCDDNDDAVPAVRCVNVAHHGFEVEWECAVVGDAAAPVPAINWFALECEPYRERGDHTTTAYVLYGSCSLEYELRRQQ
jgi:hypothetical protein